MIMIEIATLALLGVSAVKINQLANKLEKDPEDI